MNNILSIGAWLGENWMILVLIVLAVALLVPTYLKQKKEANARQELSSSIKKGVKIITTAGVYGVVETIEDTTDGKVVTIVTGNSKNPSTMTVHINAIMGIDNKTKVGKSKSTKEEVEEVEQEVAEEVVEVEDKPKKTAKKTTTKSKKDSE